MNFINKTIHKEIDHAIILAEKLLKIGSPMYHEVYFKNDWKYHNGSGIEIAHELSVKTRKPVEIYTYSPKIPWSTAIGGLKNGYIQINKRKLPFLTTVEIAANLVHEYAHYCGYTHGNNFKTKEKCLYSVPYFLSENVSKWL